MDGRVGPRLPGLLKNGTGKSLKSGATDKKAPEASRWQRTRWRVEREYITEYSKSLAAGEIRKMVSILTREGMPRLCTVCISGVECGMWSGKPRTLQLEIRRRVVGHGVVETSVQG